MKDLYNENCKILRKEIEDTIIWKDNPYLWIRIIDIFKMSALPKAKYRFSAIPTKILMAFFFTEIEKQLIGF